MPTSAELPSILRGFEEAPTPKAQPRIALRGSEEQPPPEQAEATTFIFRALTIEGAQTIAETELREAWPHAPGEQASVADIFRFAEAVTNAYRDAGYALSFALVPQQTITNGTFKIRVVEGYVERVAVEGDLAAPVRARIEERAERIKASRPLLMADLERYLLLVSDLPGVTVSGLLSPADSEGGALLTIEAEQVRFAGSFGYNNFLPDAYGRHTGEVMLEARGLVTGADLARVTARRSLTSDAYWSIWGDVSNGIGPEGFRVGATGLYSEGLPREDALLSGLDYSGTTMIAQLYAKYPLIRSRERNLDVGGTFTVNDSRADLLGAGFFDDRLRTLSLWGYYDFVDATRAVSWAKVTLSQGIDGLGARGDSRLAGRTDYTTIEFDAQRDQPIAPALGGDVWLRLGARGQATLSDDGLFSAAECTYGGQRFGRAFEAGVMVGDHCLLGLVELHWTKPVELPFTSFSFDLFGFVDGGAAWEKGELQPGDAGTKTASSAGGGINLKFNERASANFEVGRKLHLSNETDEDDWRVSGGVTLRF